MIMNDLWAAETSIWNSLFVISGVFYLSFSLSLSILSVYLSPFIYFSKSSRIRARYERVVNI
jgi:hypothetical protein